MGDFEAQCTAVAAAEAEAATAAAAAVQPGNCRQGGGRYGGYCTVSAAITQDECYDKGLAWAKIAATEWQDGVLSGVKQCALMAYAQAAPTDCPTGTTASGGDGSGDLTAYTGNGNVGAYGGVCMSTVSAAAVAAAKAEAATAAAAAVCTPTVSLVSDCDKHSIDTNYGGHVGTSLNALDAWTGSMIMWSSPLACDTKYKLIYPTAVTLTSVTAKYDAGATVKLLDHNSAQLGSTGCYESNGDTVNTCTVAGTGTGTEFYVVVDSTHGMVRMTRVC